MSKWKAKRLAALIPLTAVVLPTSATIERTTGPLLDPFTVTAAFACYDEDPCDSTSHKMEAKPNGTYNANPECMPPTLHSGSGCEGTFAIKDVLGASKEKLLQMARQKPDKLIWNEERQSFQLLGCDGKIAANIPIAVLQHWGAD